MSNAPDNISNNKIILLGDFLKEARLRKGYSLEKVSKETKITSNILKKIENNEFKDLPNITYIKGFTQNILKTLHIPYDVHVMQIIIDTYKHFGLYKIDESNIVLSEHSMSPQNENTTPPGKIFNISSLFSLKNLIALSALLILFFAYQFIDTINKQISERYSSGLKSKEQSVPETNPKSSIENKLLQNNANSNLMTPQENTPLAKNISLKDKEVIVMTNPSNLKTPPPKTTMSPTPSASATPAIAATPKATLTPKPSASPTNLAITPVANINSSEEKTLPYVKFKKISQVGIELDPSFPTETKKIIYPDSERKKIKPNKQNAYVTAVNSDAWISYKTDDSPSRSNLLKKGESLTISGDKVFINIGNTDAVEVFLNDQHVKYTSYKGVKSFIFPIEIAKNYSLPLFVSGEQGKVLFFEDYLKKMAPPPTETSAPTKE